MAAGGRRRDSSAARAAGPAGALALLLAGVAAAAAVSALCRLAAAPQAYLAGGRSAAALRRRRPSQPATQLGASASDGEKKGALGPLLELARTAGADELAARVDADFAKLTPEDLTTLQVQLGEGDESDKEAVAALTKSIQASMESRMETAKADVDALLMSSGNIEDNIRECLAKQDSPLPILAVLQLNIGKAQQAGQEKMVQALSFVFKVMNSELEKSVPAVKRLLTKALALEESSARRGAFRNFMAASPEEGLQLGPAIVQLVADCEQQFENAGATDGERRKASLELIRKVAIDAGVVIGEAYGEDEQGKFTEGLQPLFEALSRV